MLFLCKLIARLEALPLCVVAGVALITSALQLAAQDADKASYLAAISTYRAGDCLAAIPELLNVSANKPEASLPLARCYFETQSYDKAADAVNAYLQKFPEDERGTLLLSRIYVKGARPKDAISLLTRYVNQHPDSLNAQVELGRAYLANNDKDSAAGRFSNVLKQVPDYPSALFGQALIAISEQRWAQAVALVKAVSLAAPDLPDAYVALGEIYEKQDQYQNAVSPYSKAIELRPDDFDTTKKLAKCYATLDKWDQVAGVLHTGSVAEANDREATELVRRALRDNPQALEDYCRWAISINPLNTTAHGILAESLYSSKQSERAKAEFLEVLKAEKGDPDPLIYFRLGQMSEQDLKFDEARHYYEQATKTPTAEPRMFLALAHVELTLGDAPAAKDVLAKIAPPENETSEYKTMLAEVDLRTSDYKGASSIVAALLAQDGNNKKLLDLAAQIADKQEKYADEATFLDRLFALDGNDKAVRYRLVTLYTDRQELKGDQKAMDYLKDFVTRQEQDPEGYLLLANLYRRNKDWANAKVYFQLGFDHMPTPPPARLSWAYESYGLFFYYQGNMQEAFTNLSQATQLNSNDVVSQFQLGIVCIKLSNESALEQVLNVLDAKDPKRAAQLEDMARKTGMALRAKTQ